jgi:hypothetical protein
MKPGGAERRRGRRVPINASLLIRPLDEQKPQAARELTAHNISLAGVYFETDQPEGLVLNEQVVASIAIPEAERRTFPFARLAGRGRVVRIQELSPGQSQDAKRFGVALEFGRDVTALTAIPV